MPEAPKKDKKPLLGEVLVQHGLITQNMLKNALRRQSQVGGQIGSVLIDMGYITTDALLEFLSKQFGVPSVNLFKLNIPPEVLKTIPFDKIKEYKVLPIEVDEHLTIAMVNPGDMHAIKDMEFIFGRRIDPVVVPSLQMEAAIRSIEEKVEEGFRGDLLEKAHVTYDEEAPADIRQLLKVFRDTKSTDLQLTAGVPPSLKRSNELSRLNMPPLTPEDMKRLAGEIMRPEQQEVFDRQNDLDFGFTDTEFGRFRVNIYKQRNSVSITLRRIPDEIPTLRELGLPDDLEQFALKPQGLILITGPAGHGKSTTLSCLIEIINAKRKCNIITLEDPIEYLHKHRNSNVNQREIGIDTASFHEGLKHIFRQDPDVIVIGEMRDPESFRIALQAAETGHLVLSTLHSRNATSTIERVIDIFPADQQAQIRYQFAESFLLIFSQRLVNKKDGSGMVLAYERMSNSYKIRSLIRDSKTHQIRSQMQTPHEEFSSIDISLARLVINGTITQDEGMKHADDPNFFLNTVKARAVR